MRETQLYRVSDFAIPAPSITRPVPIAQSPELLKDPRFHRHQSKTA